jgi:glutathione S-transferase
MACHILLEEIGLPYRAEYTSAFSGKMTNTAEFGSINPKRRVPVLHPVPGRIGGAPDVLTEANAILLYLARTHPQASMLPVDPVGEARCLEWMNWLASNVHAISYGQLWRPQRYVESERDFPAVVSKGQGNVREQYAYIESLLSDGRDWAVPGGYSVVDMYLLVFYHWGERIELPMRSAYPAWTRLTERLLARPAVQRVLDAEGIVILSGPETQSAA